MGGRLLPGAWRAGAGNWATSEFHALHLNFEFAFWFSNLCFFTWNIPVGHVHLLLFSLYLVASCGPEAKEESWPDTFNSEDKPQPRKSVNQLILPADLLSCTLQREHLHFPLLLVRRLYLSKASVCLPLFLRNSWELIVLIVLWCKCFSPPFNHNRGFCLPISVFFLMNDSGFFTIKSSMVDFDDLYLSAVFPSTSRPSPSGLSPCKYTPMSCRQPFLRIVPTCSTSVLRQDMALPQGSPGLYHLSFLHPILCCQILPLGELHCHLPPCSKQVSEPAVG